MALNAGQVSIGLTLDDQKFTTQLKKSAAALDKFGSKLDSMGGTALKFSAALTGGFALAGRQIAKFGQEALNVGGGFEASMLRVASISGATEEELTQLTSKARELGATLPIMAKEAADALGVLASRGYDAGKMLDSVGDIVNLSIAQNYDLAASAELVSSTLTNFQLAESDTARVSDVFTQASNRSALSMEKLAFAMRYAAAPAAAMGESVESTVAALGALADAGYRGEQMGTILRAVYGKIASETEIMGVKTKDATGKIRSLAEVMSEIGQKGKGLDAFTLAFGTEAAAGALTLSKSVNRIKELNGELVNSFGATTAQVEKQMGSWQNIAKGFASRVESLYITVFDQIKNSSKTGVASLTELTEALQKWVAETEVAGKSLEAFVRGLGFEVPEGAGLKELLDSIDVNAIVQKFENAGEVLRGIADSLMNLAKAVPWEFLLNNLELIGKAAFWTWLGGKGLQAAANIVTIGGAIGTLSGKIAELAGNLGLMKSAGDAAAGGFAAAGKGAGVLGAALKGLSILSGPVGLAIATLYGFYQFGERIKADTEKSNQKMLDKAATAHERYFQAVARAQKGQLDGIDEFNEAQQRSLRIYAQRYEEEQKMEKLIKDEAGAMEYARKAIETSKGPATTEAQVTVNLEDLKRSEEILAQMLEDVQKLDLGIEGNAERYRNLFNVLQAVREQQRAMLEAPISPERVTVDFSAYTKDLEEFTKKTRDEVADAVAGGMDSKKARETFKKSMLSKIGSIAGEVEKNLGPAMAAFWQDMAERSLGLDEASQEVVRLTEAFKKSKGEILTYQQYLRQTGNTSEYAAQQLQEMTDALIEQRFAQLDPTQRQQLIDSLEKLGRETGDKYAKSLAEKLKGGTKTAISDAKKEVEKNAMTEDQILKALQKEQKGRERSKFTPTEFKEQVDIGLGFIVEMTEAEKKAYLAGTPEVVAAVKDRNKDIFAVMEQQAENARKITEDAAKEEAAIRERLMGKAPETDAADTGLKELEVLDKLLPDLLQKGQEQGAAYGQTFMDSAGQAMAANPAAFFPPVESTLPKMMADGGALWGGMKSGFDQAMAVNPVKMEPMFNSMITELNNAVPTLALTLSQAMSGIDLAPAGATVGKTFIEGIRAEIQSSNFTSGIVGDLYQKFSEQLQKELRDSGGV